MTNGKFHSGNTNSDMPYDDSAFKLFVVALLAVYWVPAALYRGYWYVKRLTHKKTPIEEAKEAWCGCSECQEKADTIRAKSAGIKGLTIGDIVFGFVTLLLLISSVTVYRANLSFEPPFDPFAILDIPKSASTRDIKKAYRRLSVIHHPDKNRDNPESAAERFLKISKAYAALTDEAAKENYIKYGNPDGYLGTSLGLGLPEWLAESSRSVLMGYAVFMVVVFPAIVGFWWHRSKQQLTSEIMTSTFMTYRETLNHTTRFRDLLTAFCGSDEFNSLYTTDNDVYMKDLQESLKKIGGLPKSKSVVEPSHSQIQNLMVMTAYLARLPVPKQLNYVLEGILQRAEPLLTSLTDTVGVFQRPDCKPAWNKMFMHGHTTFLSRCLQLTQCIYQGLDEKASPILQIPHFTEREIKFFTGRNGATKSIYDMMRLEMNDLRRILRDFSDSQILDVKAFLDRFPSASMEIEPPCVEGEEDSSVHEGDTVTIRTTLRILRRTGSAFSPHVPRLPYRKEEVWWLWLADQKRLCPVEVRRLIPRMARGHDGTKRRGFEEEDGEEDDFLGDGSMSATEREWRKRRDEEVERLASDPRVTVFEVAFKFIAPRAGSYVLEIKATCDCYAGASKSHLVKMDVKDAIKQEEENAQFSSDEDESEEDSSDDSDDSGDEEEEEEEEEEAGQEQDQTRNNRSDGDDEETDDEYEYIEVTASESEPGDFDDDDDDFGVSGVPKGDPAGP